MVDTDEDDMSDFRRYWGCVMTGLVSLGFLRGSYVLVSLWSGQKGSTFLYVCCNVVGLCVTCRTWATAHS